MFTPFLVVYVSFAQSEYNVSEGDGASAVLVQLTNVTEMTQAPIWVTLESMDGELAICKCVVDTST